MSEWPILSAIVFLPLIGALFILAIRGEDEIALRNIRWTALFTTVFTLILALILWSGFDPAAPGFQFEEKYAWFGLMSYHMGVDGLGLPFVLLTAFLMPGVIIASWHVNRRVKEYMIAFLVLETLMLGVFVSLDLVLFYIFFEGGLIPMFLIIGVWGGPRRIYATFKFFLYTLAGSVLMLIAMIAIYVHTGTTDIAEILAKPSTIPASLQYWLWLAFFASFAVKMPMWPVHTWLPDAHVEAPTAGSVVLAAILLKMGGYGFLRFSLPMFPVASEFFAPLVFVLSVIAIVYTSLVALVQEDIKKLIAYSSVAHMGYVTMGIFAMNKQGLDGAMFQMISHGLVSGALFLCVGVIYDRMHTREIAAYGGLVNRMPMYAFIFMLFTMANVGLPGTTGFIGEFLSLTGAYLANTWVALFATTGVILSAAYALWLYRNVVFGPLEKEKLKSITDMTWREAAVLLPLALLTVWFGVQPGIVTEMFNSSVNALLTQVQAGLDAAAAVQQAAVQ
ncbi:NADH-quinone oxidoreductase subunit M [Thermopetrobacter sp. TC1]|uniref:NADH-quinone oxidoreductase subunit M n=1 Tax=Thermopetrobacter sp. TC1 TaxID=1495045 RepID=UPI000570C4EF|nr:NADH-quinone oxidoreductase subunit M [Thermopetrobacter sp. TC1]